MGGWRAPLSGGVSGDPKEVSTGGMKCVWLQGPTCVLGKSTGSGEIQPPFQISLSMSSDVVLREGRMGLLSVLKG